MGKKKGVSGGKKELFLWNIQIVLFSEKSWEKKGDGHASALLPWEQETGGESISKYLKSGYDDRLRDKLHGIY